MKRKHLQREQVAQEEAIEAGHVSRAAIARLRRRTRDAARKPEVKLLEDGGTFRGGVLRLGGRAKGGGGRNKSGN